VGFSQYAITHRVTISNFMELNPIPTVWAYLGESGFLRHPSVRDVVLDPGGATLSRNIDNEYAAFDSWDGLGLHD